MYLLKSLPILLLWMTSLVPCQSHGQMELQGHWNWSTTSGQVRVTGSKITNLQKGGRSGSLKLKLYATTRPYCGHGPITGYSLFESTNLGELNGGYQFSAVNQCGRFGPPPSGCYYTTLVLIEYNRGEYLIVDWINFPGVTRF